MKKVLEKVKKLKLKEELKQQQKQRLLLKPLAMRMMNFMLQQNQQG